MKNYIIGCDPAMGTDHTVTAIIHDNQIVEIIKSKKMVTIEQIEKAFGDDRRAFQTKNVDHDLVALSLLRERIPYEVCKSIIGGAEHDILYLCDVDKSMNYLSPEDLDVLADCNVWYCEEHGCFALFV